MDIHLTPRETEVAEYVARGYPNQKITAALTVNLRTVEKHISNIRSKLGVSNSDKSVGRVMIVRYVELHRHSRPMEAAPRCWGHKLCSGDFMYCGTNVAWEVEQ